MTEYGVALERRVSIGMTTRSTYTTIVTRIEAVNTLHEQLLAAYGAWLVCAVADKYNDLAENSTALPPFDKWLCDLDDGMIAIPDDSPQADPALRELRALLSLTVRDTERVAPFVTAALRGANMWDKETDLGSIEAYAKRVGSPRIHFRRISAGSGSWDR